MTRHASLVPVKSGRSKAVRLFWALLALAMVATTFVVVNSWANTPHPTRVASEQAPSNRLALLPQAAAPQECYARGFNAGMFPPSEGPVQLSAAALESVSAAGDIYASHQLSREGTAALVANGVVESTGDPTMVQGGGHSDSLPDSHRGYGFYMWTGQHYHELLNRFATFHGGPVSNLEIQLEFLWQSLDAAPPWKDVNGCFHDPLADLKSAKSVEDATLIVCEEYIYRAPSCPNIYERIATARTVLDLLPA